MARLVGETSGGNAWRIGLAIGLVAIVVALVIWMIMSSGVLTSLR